MEEEKKKNGCWRKYSCIAAAGLLTVVLAVALTLLFLEHRRSSSPSLVADPSSKASPISNQTKFRDLLTETPSLSPSIADSTTPTVTRSITPTATASITPTVTESIPPTMTVSLTPTVTDSSTPTVMDSSIPTVTESLAPTAADSFTPTVTASFAPTVTESWTPSSVPSNVPASFRTTFFAIADVPYTDYESEMLATQMYFMEPRGVDFMVHLGDIKRGTSTCPYDTLAHVDTILNASKVPTFMVMGDNEYNDCGNANQALGWWRNLYSNYHERHWPPVDWRVQTMPGRNESFSFLLRGTLFVGLNVVGGQVHSAREWNERLTTQATWLGQQIMHGDGVLAVVLMLHTTPNNGRASDFLQPLSMLVQEYSHIPMLYLNGDAHSWRYQTNLWGQPNFWQIQLTGGVDEPILKIVVDPSNHTHPFQPLRFTSPI